ncbi:hypothetical protein [Nocardia cyriacigeorgica]|uniref:hypothetical protein n=1 Tax=Nocardia cyriacigeorgica TaxID=135487 RepID=UPI0002E6133F|nr:hypothetical protein [Nocardia cyriacigeorgica]TLF55285.1 hypothetical protein FEK31_21055 [Nocardia cyriacigeorgica]
MTDDRPIDYDDESDDTAPDWSAMIYEVFNPDHTVGVACDRDGEVVGLHLTDEARDNGDTWLAAEILRVAKLAHLKSRVGLRTEMEHKGTRPYTIDAFDLPTETSYRAMEAAEFGSSAR